MAETDPNQATASTDPQGGTPPAQDPPAPTDGSTPPATDPKGDDAATSDPDQVTLSRKDYNKLIGQRDRGNAQNGFVEMLAQERIVDDFLKDKAEKYPDLNRDDLLHVSDPDDLDTEATRLQRRFEETTQKRLLNLTRADAPQMTADERSAELKKLSDNPDANSFERMLDLQLPSTKKS